VERVIQRPLVIVGNDGGTNIGASLRRAAAARGLDVTLVNAQRAFAGPRALARLNWWLRGRRPARLKAFGREVLETCRELRPSQLISTGLAPLDRETLAGLERLGVERINYLTDDPWNPAFRSRWFLDALPLYDRVWSVRTSNLDDLRRHGCAGVAYLPFGFDPELFFPEAPTDAERPAYESDICFAGGADTDRVPYMAALAHAGLSLALYGDYWSRFSETKRADRGHAGPEVLRKAASGAAVSLCLVRRANRDGHTMRSFEVPAVGGCMLAEDTDEHRVFFGPSGHAVVYFSTMAEMVDRARGLLADPAERTRLAAAAHRLIAAGGFTYADRRETMLLTVSR
jgi:spore maturation protein CgeB